MNLLVSSNDAYLVPLKVMLHSFFTSNPSPIPHTVYMLHADLSERADGEVRSLVESFGGVYRSIPVDASAFEGAATRIHISRETYYRLLAAEYLPQEVDRVLWLDADLIVRKPLDGLYGLDLEGNWAAACSYGPQMLPLILRNAVSIGLSDPGSYFNAGVMLYDLGQCRKVDFAAARDAFFRVERKLLFPGQDLVNTLFDGHVRIVDWRVWNSMIHCIAGSEDLAYAREHAAIVHYPGQAKPWKFYDIHFADEWKRLFRECYGPDAPLRTMSYFALQALFNQKKEH